MSMQEASLVIVDMQKDFMPGGSLEVPKSSTILPIVNCLVEQFIAFQRPIIYTADWHPEITPHFDEWPVHCVAYTEGSFIHDYVKVPPMSYPLTYFVRKGIGESDGYSGFSEEVEVAHMPHHDPIKTDLSGILQMHGTRRIWICGLALDYCVKATALDALERGYGVVVITDGTVPVDPETGQRALEELVEAGADLYSFFHS